MKRVSLFSALTALLFAGALTACDSKESDPSGGAPNTTGEANNETRSGLALPESGGAPNDDVQTNQGLPVVQIEDIKKDPAKVRDFQSALEAKGFKPGEINGVWGASTQKAFEAFKRSNGIETDALNAQALKALGLDPKRLERRPASAE